MEFWGKRKNVNKIIAKYKYLVKSECDVTPGGKKRKKYNNINKLKGFLVSH